MRRHFEDVLVGSIELFCAAAEYGSFTVAANAVGVTPAAVTNCRWTHLMRPVGIDRRLRQVGPGVDRRCETDDPGSYAVMKALGVASRNRGWRCPCFGKVRTIKWDQLHFCGAKTEVLRKALRCVTHLALSY